MKVKAIRKGFYGGNIQLPGVEFSIDSKDQLGTWMEEVKQKPKAKKQKVKAEKPEE